MRNGGQKEGVLREHQANHKSPLVGKLRVAFSNLFAT